jgi:hypothetical protein
MRTIAFTSAIWLLSAACTMGDGRIIFWNTRTTPLLINNGQISWSGDLTQDPVITPGPTTQVLGAASTAAFGIGPASTEIRLYAGLTSSSMVPIAIGSGGSDYVLNTANTTIASVQGTFIGGDAGTVDLGLPEGMVFLRFTATSINGLYLGVSPIIETYARDLPGTPSNVFTDLGPVLGHWDSVTMYAIPEPTSVALLSVGTAAILIFRRQK